MTGKKADTGKPEFDLLSFEALAELNKVHQYGNQKYDIDNWKEGLKFRRLINAAIRHLTWMLRGQLVDPETGLLHSAHVMANAEFLTHYQIYLDKYADFDDLPIWRPEVNLTNPEITLNHKLCIAYKSKPTGETK